MAACCFCSERKSHHFFILLFSSTCSASNGACGAAVTLPVWHAAGMCFCLFILMKGKCLKQQKKKTSEESYISCAIWELFTSSNGFIIIEAV